MSAKALLVGINDYGQKPLSGCLNDVKATSAALQNYYAVDPHEIVVLTDGAARARSIVGALAGMVGAGQAGDRLLFYFSGHGAIFADEAGIPHDVLCPHDLAWTRDTVIMDDDLRAAVAALRPGVALTVVVDCCNSGDLARLVKHRPSRFLVAPAEIGDRLLTTEQPRALAAAHDRYALLAACASDEEAAELEFDGRSYGAFTACLLGRLNSALGRAEPLTALATDLANKLGPTGQHPQIKGDPVLSTRPFYIA